MPCGDRSTSRGDGALRYNSNSGSTCCGQTFPINDSVTFSNCLNEFALASDDYASWYSYSIPSINVGWAFSLPDWLFESDKLVFMEVVVSTKTSETMAGVYESTSDLYKQVKTFSDEMRRKAPPGSGLDSLEFVSYSLLYYDFLNELFSGMYMSAAISSVIATLALLCMTHSVIMTVSSVLTIFSIVLLVCGILIFVGWQLNVIESLIITVSVGLAHVDFTVHYSHTYLVSNDKSTRRARTSYMYTAMGVSVTFGALTTFLSGFALSFAEYARAFYQFGVFLMVLMSLSFLYSTFFLGSILHVIGPVKPKLIDSKQDHA